MSARIHQHSAEPRAPRSSGHVTRTAAEERELAVWAAGWDAAVAWLWPQLVRAQADADRLYRVAYPLKPHEWHDRLGRALNDALRAEVNA